MNAIAKRIAFIASLLAISVTTGCASLSTGGDGYAFVETDDILAQMAADSNSGGE